MPFSTTTSIMPSAVGVNLDARGLAIQNHQIMNKIKKSPIRLIIKFIINIILKISHCILAGCRSAFYSHGAARMTECSNSLVICHSRTLVIIECRGNIKRESNEHLLNQEVYIHFVSQFVKYYLIFLLFFKGKLLIPLIFIYIVFFVVIFYFLSFFK